MKTAGILVVHPQNDPRSRRLILRDPYIEAEEMNRKEGTVLIDIVQEDTNEIVMNEAVWPISMRGPETVVRRDKVTCKKHADRTKVKSMKKKEGEKVNSIKSQSDRKRQGLWSTRRRNQMKSWISKSQ